MGLSIGWVMVWSMDETYRRVYRLEPPTPPGRPAPRHASLILRETCVDPWRLSFAALCKAILPVCLDASLFSFEEEHWTCIYRLIGPVSRRAILV